MPYKCIPRRAWRGEFGSGERPKEDHLHLFYCRNAIAGCQKLTGHTPVHFVVHIGAVCDQRVCRPNLFANGRRNSA